MAPPKVRKVALMGFKAVGKSSISIQFVEGHFVDSYDPTIENTFTKAVKHKGHDFTMELVDTAGQDEYSIVPNAYTANVHGYILVYSVASEKSFEMVSVIRDKILDKLGVDTIPLVLVGNKCDLHRERLISTERGKSLADKWNAAFIEASAKHNHSVDEIFQTAIKEVEKRSNPEEPNDCIIL
ncbi:uncharacterized protein LOC135826460 [Sycon ciliatum]|uniref:uncharacterized protein LOC135826460 n=1 Tax=Sycon ciliatum TaxID=27933 RepID=UPI0020AB6EF3|eukprot:scpid72600/ scgid11715/ GTP-binding protein rhb1; GTP-binding protein Rheb homolog